MVLAGILVALGVFLSVAALVVGIVLMPKNSNK